VVADTSRTDHRSPFFPAGQSGDDLVADMVKQGQELAFRKFDRILAALAAAATENGR
jgi:hypothetical protein